MNCTANKKKKRKKVKKLQIVLNFNFILNVYIKQSTVLVQKIKVHN